MLKYSNHFTKHYICTYIIDVFQIVFLGLFYVYVESPDFFVLTMHHVEGYITKPSDNSALIAHSPDGAVLRHGRLYP